MIQLLEDPSDYRAFEMAVTADYDGETAVERELVLRLASLLWRLRRATSIETGLFQVEYQQPSERQPAPQAGSAENGAVVAMFPLAIGRARTDADCGSIEEKNMTCSASRATTDGFELALRFLRLADLDNRALERLGRYEAALWRQVRQTIFTLEALRWRPPQARGWRTHDRWQRAARSSSDSP